MSKAGSFELLINIIAGCHSLRTKEAVQLPNVLCHDRVLCCNTLGLNVCQDGDKPSRKVRPGFQTWAPRRGGRGEEEAEDAGPPGVHALTAARAAAAAALRAENKATGDAHDMTHHLG